MCRHVGVEIHRGSLIGYLGNLARPRRPSASRPQRSYDRGVQPAPASHRRTTVRIALFVLGVVVVLSVAELTSHRFKVFTGGHSLISTFITEAVLLVGVYLV